MSARRTCIRSLIRAFRGSLAATSASSIRIQGSYVYPDAVVADGKEDPQWLYTVIFDGRELWGADSDPTLEVSIEAFEPYLEEA